MSDRPDNIPPDGCKDAPQLWKFIREQAQQIQDLEKNYISAVEGRADFRRLYNEKRKQIQALKADNEALRLGYDGSSGAIETNYKEPE